MIRFTSFFAITSLAGDYNIINLIFSTPCNWIHMVELYIPTVNNLKTIFAGKVAIFKNVAFYNFALYPIWYRLPIAHLTSSVPAVPACSSSFFALTLMFYPRVPAVPAKKVKIYNSCRHITVNRLKINSHVKFFICWNWNIEQSQILTCSSSFLIWNICLNLH